MSRVLRLIEQHRQLLHQPPALCKDLAHVDLPAVPIDAPARRQENDRAPIVKGVLELVEALVDARGRTAAAGRRRRSWLKRCAKVSKCALLLEDVP
jgi:hypothetical protein